MYFSGVFGFIGICLVMIPLNFIYAPFPFANNARGTLESTIDAFTQIGNDGRLFMAIVGKKIPYWDRLNIKFQDNLNAW